MDLQRYQLAVYSLAPYLSRASTIYQETSSQIFCFLFHFPPSSDSSSTSAVSLLLPLKWFLFVPPVPAMSNSGVIYTTTPTWLVMHYSWPP